MTSDIRQPFLPSEKYQGEILILPA